MLEVRSDEEFTRELASAGGEPRLYSACASRKPESALAIPCLSQRTAACSAIAAALAIKQALVCRSRKADGGGLHSRLVWAL